MIRKIKKANGWVRLWVWGFCPECNSDAPKIDTCTVCLGHRSWEGRIDKKSTWKRFIDSYNMEERPITVKVVEKEINYNDLAKAISDVLLQDPMTVEQFREYLEVEVKEGMYKIGNNKFVVMTGKGGYIEYLTILGKDLGYKVVLEMFRRGAL